MLNDETNNNSELNNEKTDKNNESENNFCDPKLKECQVELNKIKNAYLHLAADFENYKKRSERENSKIAFISQANVLIKFLPVIDDFQRAFKKGLDNQSSEVQAWLKGFEMINHEFKKLFDSLEIKEVQLDTFDPEIHEAIAQLEIPGKESGQIIDYVEKGYTYKGELIRPAKVSVAK